MQIVKYPSSIDLDAFEATSLKTYYGLPSEIEYCTKCVISNQRPSSAVEFSHQVGSQKQTIVFKDGVCDACRVAEKKKNTDWDDRERQLVELCDRYRKSDGGYDCLIPGSGGKDSFYAAHLLKYKYGMNPLTVTWAPHIYTEWGFKNFQSWIHAGFDNYLMTPNGAVHRLLTRLAVDNLFHPFQPFMIGQKGLAPKIASKFGIKLVFYGENESEYGNPMDDANSAVRDWKYFASENLEEVYLGGVQVGSLIDDFGLTKNDLDAYMPVNPELLSNVGLEVHYLGYYIKWHPQSAYYYAVDNGGFIPSPERTPGTYSKYNSIDDKIDDLHYFTTGVKFGLGRATYDASQEIRSGDITRDEGVALVKRFDHEFPARFIDELFSYLSVDEKLMPLAYRCFEEPKMDRHYFDALADKFRSPHLWKKSNDGWALRVPLA